MEFGIWGASVHENADQKKRFSSALTGKLIPLSVDFENQTGNFNGSGKEPYNTTLQTCTCSDFKRRKLPCKHIYRLAIELNLIDTGKNTVQKREYGNDEKTLKDKAKKYIDTLDEENAIIFARYCFEIHNRDSIVMKKQDVPSVITASNVFEDSKNIIAKLSFLKRAELMDLLSDTDLKVKSLKKAELVMLLINNPTHKMCDYLDTITALSAKEAYKPLLVSLHRYARKLYPQEQNYWW